VRWSMGYVLSVVLAAVLIAVSGCAVQYTYGGATYASRADAIAALRSDLDASLAGIVPVPNPLGGLATVILPSLSTANSKGVVRTGNTGSLQDEAASYVAETLLLGWEGNVDALRRGRVFSSVSVAMVDNPADVAKTAGGDTVIWLDLVDPNTAQWYGFDRDGNVVALPVDMGAPLGTPRMQKWIVLVSEALAGGGASSPKVPAKPAEKRT
jgi:hypothetical protein